MCSLDDQLVRRLATWSGSHGKPIVAILNVVMFGKVVLSESTLVLDSVKTLRWHFSEPHNELMEVTKGMVTKDVSTECNEYRPISRVNEWRRRQASKAKLFKR